MRGLSENGVKKRGLLKRLCSESLILSRLADLSSRLISYIRVSFCAGIFRNSGRVDSKLAEGFLGSAIEETEYKKKILKPVKKFFAEAVENSTSVNLYRKLISTLLCTPLNSYGAFFLTLGLFMAITYYFKLFAVSSVTPDSNQIIIAGLTAFFAFPLFFSRKSLATALDESAVFKRLLSPVIDLSSYSADKEAKARSVGMPFILGVFIGALTYFVGAASVLLVIAISVLAAVVIYSPESGVLLAAFSFSFIEADIFRGLIALSAMSFICKLFRAKRNIRFEAADIFVLIFGVYLLFESGNEGNSGFALYAVILYFLALNLLTTKGLVRKCISALVSGLLISLLTGAVQLFMSGAEGALASTVKEVNSVFDSSGEYAVYLTIILPFVYCKTSITDKKYMKALGLVLSALCVGYIVMAGNSFLVALAAISAFIYMAVGERRIILPAILCAGVPVIILNLFGLPHGFRAFHIYEKMTEWFGAAEASLSHFILGVGSSKSAVALALDGKSSGSAFLQILVEGGFAALFIFVIAVILLLGRIFAQIGKNGTEGRKVASALGAASITALLFAFCSDIWAEPKICVCFWIAFALTAAAYRTRRDAQRDRYYDEILDIRRI